MRRTAAALVLVGALAACPKPDAYNLRALSSEQAVARTMNVARRHERLSGLVKAKLPGIQGVVASVDLDVAIEPPGRASVAVRSFFEQPMQILVCDGAEVTLYDATQGEPMFFRGPADARTVQKVLPLPVAPAGLVEVMLARPPDGAHGRLLAVDEGAGTYQVWLEAPDHAPMSVTVRAQDDAIVRWRAFTGDGRPLLDVEYADFRAVDALALPFSWTITRLDDAAPAGTAHRVEVHAVDVQWNGAPLPDDAFHLEPPPGLPLRPL